MPDTQYLTAVEHQAIPIGPHGLTPAEADALALLGERWPGFCARGYRSVRLAQYCGVVNLGHRMLEILPKVDDGASPDQCRGVLLRLLRVSGELPFAEQPSAAQHLRHAPLLDVFIAAFFDAVGDVVRGGLRHQYREHDDDLTVVRGRIHSNRQFGVHANRGDRVACRFDDLTADNVWNRSLKAGLRVVRPWVTSLNLHRQWSELAARLSDVGDAAIDLGTLDRLVWDRQAVRYRRPIAWVRWILALLSPSLRAGEHAAPGLLFDVNLLFERSIADVFRRRALETGVEIVAQATGRHLAHVHGTGRKAFGLRPDLVLCSGKTVAAIGDTKWKRLDVDQHGTLVPDRADVYQMHAYAAAFGCERLALIYPWHAGLAGSRETTFELASAGTTPILSVVCVDVGSDGFDVRRGSVPGVSAAASVAA